MSTLLALSLGAASAMAQSPWWRLHARSVPTHLSPGGEGEIVVTASNLGDDETSGAITITDDVPSGLTVTQASVKRGFFKGNQFEPERTSCPVTEEHVVTCTFPRTLLPYEALEVAIRVKVTASPGELTDVAEVKGGGAPSIPPESATLTVSAASTPFGIERYELTPEEEGGALDTRAGSHPFQLTTTLDLSQGALEVRKTKEGEEGRPSTPALLKDLQVKLPPGLIGNVNTVPQCSSVDFATVNNSANRCKSSTAVGVAVVTLNEPNQANIETRAVPVFNVEPAPGEPARFGFFVLHDLVILDTSVRTAEGYAVAVSVSNASQTADVLDSEVTLWGEPGSASHDNARGWTCVEGGINLTREECSEPEPESRSKTPFLRLPTSCSVSLESTAFADSWLEPGSYLPDGSIDKEDPRWAKAVGEPPATLEGGCDSLPFGAQLEEASPTTQAASTPTGLNVDVKSPQEPTLKEGGVAEADVRDTTVTLPAGVQLSPSAANGLAACSEAQMGFRGEDPQTGEDEFRAAPPNCPDASKIGTVRIETPVLSREGEVNGKPLYEPLEGSVYLAEQERNPFGSLFALYLVAESPRSKILVKLAGKVEANEATGQLTTTFANTPQTPFEDLKMHFFEGARAPLSTPPLCGGYTAEALFSAWSGSEPLRSFPAFSITSGAEGSGCAGVQPFSPSFNAGPSKTDAGAYTPFTLTINRPDADQALGGVSMQLPPGFAGMVSHVTRCTEAQANSDSCPAGSLIGTATVSAGLGPEPITEVGRVYLTEGWKAGPFAGDPFGLSIVTPTAAGPFNFGDVITRSGIKVDPYTAVLTIDSEVPTMLNTPSHKTGVPVQLKQINVTVNEHAGDRQEGFEFNPTNCGSLATTGTLTGAQGARAGVSYPFRVQGCDKLPFKPTFSAETEGHTSKLAGASLRVKVTSQGLGQSNIAKTKVALPLQLPSRLTTIQKACVDSVFAANPASCPEGSNVGTATIHTPVFSNPLSGPAYLVSHGNAAFPDLEFVLQGEGVTIILDGKTDIKKGITTTTFEALPDAPFESFETNLPEGPHSALAANANLCSVTTAVKRRARVPLRRHGHVVRRHGHVVYRKHRVHGRLVYVKRTVTRQVPAPLLMPTTLTAQNGVVIKQETKIAVTGCQAVKGSKSKKKPKKHRKHKKK